MGKSIIKWDSVLKEKKKKQAYKGSKKTPAGCVLRKNYAS